MPPAKPNAKPSETGSCWRGGATKRARNRTCEVPRHSEVRDDERGRSAEKFVRTKGIGDEENIMTPLIEFKNLSKIYHTGEVDVRAADRVSFKIYENEFVAIMGQSGSGKSTCMHIIGCLDTPTSGKYYLDGRDVGKMRDNELADIRNRRIGFVFQQYNLLPRLNVLENVELSMLYAGIPKRVRRKQAGRVLSKVGLSDKIRNRPNQLSGGQQQRVSIARALVGRPSVILADEPTGALDSQTGHEVIGLLSQLNNEGHTIVIITHDHSIAVSANRIIQLEDGRVTYDGPTGEYEGSEVR